MATLPPGYVDPDAVDVRYEGPATLDSEDGPLPVWAVLWVGDDQAATLLHRTLRTWGGVLTTTEPFQGRFGIPHRIRLPDGGEGLFGMRSGSNVHEVEIVGAGQPPFPV